MIRRPTSTRSGSASTAPRTFPSPSTWARSTRRTCPAKVAGYDTVINDATYFSAPTLEKCTGLKHIVFLGTGAASFVDIAAAQKLGIKVSTIAGYGDTTVAEHAMGLVFAAARHIATMHGIVRGGGWRPMQGMELRGKTLGIVGLGGIGARDGAARQRHRA